MGRETSNTFTPVGKVAEMFIVARRCEAVEMDLR